MSYNYKRGGGSGGRMRQQSSSFAGVPQRSSINNWATATAAAQQRPVVHDYVRESSIMNSRLGHRRASRLLQQTLTFYPLTHRDYAQTSIMQ